MVSKTHALRVQSRSKVKAGVSLGALAVLCGIVAVPVSASAQAALEEIIVTATKRETSLQATPHAISAMTSATLETMGVDNFNDFYRSVPSFSVIDAGPGQKRYAIRGIQSPGEAQVAVYYDEIPVAGPAGLDLDSGNNQPDIKLWDVERVEILRGPQGTLYGASSTGGTVRIIANKPDASKIDAAVEGSLSSTRLGGENYHINGMINLPLVEDKLAVRVTGYYRDESGYIDNVTLGLKDINDEETWGGRFAVKLNATENLSILATAYLQRSKSFDRPLYVDSISTKNNLVTDVESVNSLDDDVELYNLTLNYDFGWANLVATTSYFDRDFLQPSHDNSRYLRTILPPFLWGAMTPATQTPYFRTKSWNHEVRLSSQDSGRLNWTIGGFWQDRKAKGDNRIVLVDPATGIPSDDEADWLFRRLIDSKIEQRAVFGEIGYEIVDGLTATVGLRWFDMSRDEAGQVTIPFGPFPITPYTVVSFSENDVMQKYHIEYKFSDAALVYVQASQGFRLGGPNQQGLPQIPDAFESDALWNYEFGWKTAFLDNRVVFNGALYHISWSDIQVMQNATPFRFITNGGKAKVDGFELELIVAPVEGLQIAGTVTHTKARLSEDLVGGNIVDPGFKGAQLPNVPKWSAAASATYEFPVTDDWAGLFYLGWQYTGGSNTTYDPGNTFYMRKEGYHLVNASFGVENDHWRVALFVNNLFDERTHQNRIFSDYLPPSTVTSTPRTIGIRAGYRL